MSTTDEYTDTEQREVYPNAQLQLVAAEVRFPFSPRLGSDEALEFFADRLSDVLPITEPVPFVEHTFVFGATEPQTDVKGRSSFRMASRDRTTAATLAPNRFVLETTDYERYGTFRHLLRRLLEVLEQYSRPAGVERVGLRYIDEIKITSIGSAEPASWEPYIDSALLAAAEHAVEVLPEKRPRVWSGLVQLEGNDQTTIVIRYGALEGHAVQPNGPLRVKRQTEPAPFFLFDIDSYWTAEEVIHDFDLDTLTTIYDRLHRPVSNVFERCITERLRNEVLRKEPVGATRGGYPPHP